MYLIIKEKEKALIEYYSHGMTRKPEIILLLIQINRIANSHANAIVIVSTS